MKLDFAAYDHLVTHIVPGPKSLSYFVPFVLLPIALLIPSAVLSRWQTNALVLPVMTATTIHAWFAIGGVDVLTAEHLLWSLYLLAFNNVEEDFKRVFPISKRSKRVHFNDKLQTMASGAFGTKQINVPLSPPATSKSYTQIAYPATLADRLSWVGTLVISLRLTDWKIGDPSHDAKQPAKRASRPSYTRFFSLALLQVLSGYIVLDLTAAYVSNDPYFHDHAISVSDPLPLPFSWPWLPPRLWRSLIIVIQAWALISPQYHIPCIIPVILHRIGLVSDSYAPHLWPAFFGPPSVVLDQGLRGLWGSYWHQTLRHAVSGPGKFLSDMLGLRKGSLGRYAIVATMAFLCSGVVHMGLVPSEPLYSSVSANTVRLLFAGFFWMQPVGILAEVVVARAVKEMGLFTLIAPGKRRPVKRVVNLLWLLCWGSISLPLFGEAMRQMGYWRVWPVPVSLYRGLKHDDWLVWTSRG